MTPEEEWDAILPGLGEPEERRGCARDVLWLLLSVALAWVAVALGVAALVNR